MKRGFNLERTKFFEASLSDTLSRSNQLQSTRRENGNSQETGSVTMTFSLFGTVKEKMWNFLLKKLTNSILK